MSYYSEQLKDPRWQKKRLEIFQRDGWACQVCNATDKPLNVHHQAYHRSPWDTDSNLLVTMCDECHAEITAMLVDIKAAHPCRIYELHGYLVGRVQASSPLAQGNPLGFLHGVVSGMAPINRTAIERVLKQSKCGRIDVPELIERYKASWYTDGAGI